ncbi:MAG: hypothetical protein LBL61_01360, partial [Elusimicrobiota bacterium]|nr:hypothetical protein [Elusimicrobiota bacterium]
MIENKNRKTNISLISLLSLAAGLVFCASQAAAQTAMVTNNFVAYPHYPTSGTSLINTKYQCQIGSSYYPGSKVSDGAKDGMPFSTSKHNRSFYSTSVATDVSPSSNMSTDPWLNAALMEYDQPTANYGTITSASYLYPNHCLTLCAEVSCSNPVRSVKMENGAAPMFARSGEFPIQTVLFEVFKYQKNVNPYSPDSTPPIRTIALYPAQEDIKKAMCRGVGAFVNYNKAGNAEGSESCCKKCFNTDGSRTDWCGAGGQSDSANTEEWKQCGQTEKDFDPDGVSSTGPNAYTNCVAGETKLRFCAPWDGSYEIDGEFGKSNGQFGYRTTISTKWPGDGVSTS